MRNSIALLMVCCSAPALAQTADIRFGNLHSHTSYSDGMGTPRQAYQQACAVAGLDFFAITQHNHSKGDGSGERNDGLLIAASPQLYRGDQESLVSPGGKVVQTFSYDRAATGEVLSIEIP